MKTVDQTLPTPRIEYNVSSLSECNLSKVEAYVGDSPILAQPSRNARYPGHACIHNDRNTRLDDKRGTPGERGGNGKEEDVDKVPNGNDNRNCRVKTYPSKHSGQEMIDK